jgi:hypothetical protein
LRPKAKEVADMCSEYAGPWGTTDRRKKKSLPPGRMIKTEERMTEEERMAYYRHMNEIVQAGG